MVGIGPGLPAATNRLVARDEDIAGVIDGLRAARQVTITGPGGVGKTRLALQVGRELGRGPMTLALVDLSQLDDPARVPAAFAEGLGAARASNDVIGDVARSVAGLDSLLVVDNCEHVQDAAASVILALLERCPQLRILATSRETLRLPGELVWTLGPLAPDAAVELFVERAEALRPGAGSDRATIEKICARLDGMPLALELAAGRTSSLSTAEVLARLGEGADLLATRTRGIPHRHRNLRAAIEWSIELLSESEREAFNRVSVFPGTFTLEAAEAVAQVELDTIDDLVTKSLISVTSGSEGELRYRLLDTVRAYGRELLVDAQHVRSRHLTFYVELAERVQTENALGGSDADVHRLAGELPNLRMALDWAEQRDPSAGLRLLGAGREAWFARSQAEGRERAARLLAQHRAADRPRALGLLGAGRLAVAHQGHDDATTLLTEAIEIARVLDERGILACTHHYLGISGMLARNLDAAAAHLIDSIALFRELGQDHGVGRGLGILGFVRLYQGRREEAERVFEDARAILESLEDAWGLGQSSLGLGLAAKSRDDADAAIAHLSRAILSLVSAGDATILGVAMSTLGGLTFEDDPHRAVRLAAAASAFRIRIGGEYPPGTVAELDAIRARATERLGQAECDSHWEAGLRLSPAIIAELIDPSPRPRSRSAGTLTPRQREVAGLVAEGLTNAQVAARLHLSERTVENHVFNAISALGLHNRVQLATWLSREGGTPAAASTRLPQD
jgi:predicted ATPase/DNA-binding CsgD family transcriptional regulator